MIATGGSAASRAASADGTPWASRPWLRVAGSDEARPRMISVKKMPMDRTMAEFWNVALMPAPTPRRSGGRLFMIPARLGEANSPMPIPFISRINANCQYSKLTGSSSSSTNESAATSMPPVANGRAPNRSDSQPEAGPAMRKPTVSGSMAIPAHSGVRSKL